LADNHSPTSSVCVDQFLENKSWDKQFDKLFAVAKDELN